MSEPIRLPKPLKPWRSIEEQLKLLASRNLQIDCHDAARNYLQRIGYYRLSGYWYPMRRTEGKPPGTHLPVRGDEFINGSRFEDAVHLYIFDKKLRLLALDALERIEMALRVDIAYVLGKRDPLAHETPEHLDGVFTRPKKAKGKHSPLSDHQTWLSKYREQVRRAQKQPFIQHHQKAYQGSLPIWVAVEVWDFGMLSKMYSGMKYADREQIAQRYRANSSKTLSQWLRSLNFVRNVCAHHGRLWNINILELSAPLPDWPSGLNTARPFFYFSIMQKLLRVICPNSSWGTRFRSLLLQEFPIINNVELTVEAMGAYPGWQDWDLWEKVPD